MTAPMHLRNLCDGLLLSYGFRIQRSAHSDGRGMEHLPYVRPSTFRKATSRHQWRAWTALRLLRKET